MITIHTAMHFKGKKLVKGEVLRIASINELITIDKTNILGNGRTEIIYYYTNKGDSHKHHVYLDVLELLGLERVDT